METRRETMRKPFLSEEERNKFAAQEFDCFSSSAGIGSNKAKTAIKAIYVTQRMYDEFHRNIFGAEHTDRQSPTVSGNIFVGIPIIVNNFIQDPPGILAVREDGSIVYPEIIGEPNENVDD